jgi:hypothetical protein
MMTMSTVRKTKAKRARTGKDQPSFSGKLPPRKPKNRAARLEKLVSQFGPHLTTGCRRRQTASARPSLPLSAAPEPQRSASNGRLSWGEQASSILSQYPAILDIATDLSLNQLSGFFR